LKKVGAALVIVLFIGHLICYHILVRSKVRVKEIIIMAYAYGYGELEDNLIVNDANIEESSGSNIVSDKYEGKTRSTGEVVGVKNDRVLQMDDIQIMNQVTHITQV